MCSINPGSAQLDSQKLKSSFSSCEFLFEREGRKTGEIRVVVLIFLRSFVVVVEIWMNIFRYLLGGIEKGLLNFLRGSSENHKGQLSIFLEGEGEGRGLSLSYRMQVWDHLTCLQSHIFLSRFCRASAWFLPYWFLLFLSRFFSFSK